MRGFLSSTFLIATASVLAQAQTGALGTKPDVVAHTATSPQPVVGGWEFVQMGLALAIVFGLLKFGLPKLMAKFGRSLSTNLNSEIKLQEAASFGAGTLQVVEVRGKTLLLSVGQQGVNFLADLTDGTAKNTEHAFFEILEDKVETADIPTHAVIAQPAQKKAHVGAKTYAKTNEPSNDPVESRLNRLKKLAS